MTNEAQMRRREFVEGSAALGLLAAFSLVVGTPGCRASFADQQEAVTARNIPIRNPQTPTAHGQSAVAFVISKGTVMIKLAGPWEFFNYVMMISRGPNMNDQMRFRIYTVPDAAKAWTRRTSSTQNVLDVEIVIRIGIFAPFDRYGGSTRAEVQLDI
jgi:hypothetical protein